MKGKEESMNDYLGLVLRAFDSRARVLLRVGEGKRALKDAERLFMLAKNMMKRSGRFVLLFFRSRYLHSWESIQRHCGRQGWQKTGVK